MNIRKQLFMDQCQATSLIYNKHGALLAISYTDIQREETGVPGPKKKKNNHRLSTLLSSITLIDNSHLSWLQYVLNVVNSDCICHHDLLLCIILYDLHCSLFFYLPFFLVLLLHSKVCDRNERIYERMESNIFVNALQCYYYYYNIK